MWRGAFVLGCLFFFVLSSTFLYRDYTGSGPLSHKVIFTVKPGQGAYAIATALEDNHVLRSRFSFLLVAALRGEIHKMQAGDYEFKVQSSLKEILDKITQGKIKKYIITFPEGLTVQQIVAKLRDEVGLSGEVTTLPEEGSLFPSTYFFNRGDARQTIIDRMARQLNDVMKGVGETPAQPDLLKTPKDILTLASLVEKETAVESERVRVASVLLNRLRIGLPLQSDPSVIYGIRNGADFDYVLKRSDLKRDHPFTTYGRRGLPSTPICCPGKASIQAVLQALPTKELYFVADGSGGHVFATDYKDHLQNVSRWRNRKRDEQNKDLQETK